MGKTLPTLLSTENGALQLTQSRLTLKPNYVYWIIWEGNPIHTVVYYRKDSGVELKAIPTKEIKTKRHYDPVGTCKTPPFSSIPGNAPHSLKTCKRNKDHDSRTWHALSGQA